MRQDSWLTHAILPQTKWNGQAADKSTVNARGGGFKIKNSLFFRKVLVTPALYHRGLPCAQQIHDRIDSIPLRHAYVRRAHMCAWISLCDSGIMWYREHLSRVQAFSFCLAILFLTSQLYFRELSAWWKLLFFFFLIFIFLLKNFFNQFTYFLFLFF